MLRAFPTGLLAALAALTLSTSCGAATSTDCAKLEIMAHRGYHEGSVDENSLTAFGDAGERGYAIETDARADADGQIWLFHDADVHRATGADGDIQQMHTAQVAALRYLKGGAPLASLDDAISVWQKYPKTSIYLEPKVQAIIPRLAAKLGAAGLLSRVYFTAYDAWIQGTLPDLKTAPKLSGSLPDPTALKSQGTDAVMVDEGELSSSQVDGYHSAGLRVQQAETDERDKWRAAIRKGFDSILTDSPDELKAFCPSV